MSDDVRLIEFAAHHARRVAGWATSAEETERWCGATAFPVAAETVLAWQSDGVRAFVLLRDDVPVAYGEIWTDDDEQEVELARLIVAPTRRSRGIGRTLVAHLVRRAAETPHPVAYMRVRTENTSALRCYAAGGFERVASEKERAFNVGQPYAYAWLRRTLRSD